MQHGRSYTFASSMGHWKFITSQFKCLRYHFKFPFVVSSGKMRKGIAVTNVTNFEAKNGKKYEILIDDDGVEISVARDGVVLGKIELDYRESDFGNDPDRYHITHLALEGCPSRVGIGRACLQYHVDCFGAPITAGSDSGLKASDGSHLTGSGPGFISQMRKERLVVSDGSHWDRYDED